MSFSLSSLLNPEPAGRKKADDDQEQRRESIPANPYVQSPDSLHAAQSQSIPPSARTEDAAQALASFSASQAAAPTHYYGYSAPDDRSSATELPPPPPPPARKMSSHSPTLEQYQVASRSPEQRRASMAAAAPLGGVTLPPIHSRREQESGNSANASQGAHVQHAGVDPPHSVQSHNSNSAHSHPALPALTYTASADTVNTTAPIKQEAATTPLATTPVAARRPSFSDVDGQTPKPVASLKSELSLRVQSPLRESSVPVPSTETAMDDKPAVSKKRPAPSKKKGTATTAKKEKTTHASKKRKIDRSETPASRPSGKHTTLKTTSSMAGSSPAPSARSRSADPDQEDEEEFDEDEDVEGSGDVYCFCRKPDNGTFMIGCDGTCDDWYHGKCVGVEERDKKLIDAYYCPACTRKGEGLTTWKRMCRRPGCRLPARIAGRGPKGGEPKGGSKYCSQECGVTYFRDMVARTRDRDEGVRSRTSRRMGSMASSDRLVKADEALGSKGGVLAAGEVKSLVESSKTADNFRKLGEGVLSPPATPDGKSDPTTTVSAPEYTESESAALENIHRQKENARRRHGSLKNRMKFATLVKQAASRTTKEREVKPKDYCGYDPRLEWTEEQLAAWLDSAAGQQAFELETLQTENSGPVKAPNGDTEMADGDDTLEDGVLSGLAVCERKKCARHLEWGKLVVDDVRFEMGDNSDKMRALDREEREIRERVALRMKSGGNVNGEGFAEVHAVLVGGDGGTGMTGGEAEGMEGMEGVQVGSKAERAIVESVEAEKTAHDLQAEAGADAGADAMVVDAVV
ncbi:hypothetical protein B0A50_06699 [Salinomyces thailandicus]|uniref:PHD-type domain-containing protein n=1 Tax=Salinomyces thailandicus TaxID=706561 RepID=A0A4V5N3N7_9PEZI|nr:hypothetical protein B0A50_06699 [Salinomyces thailandica]